MAILLQCNFQANTGEEQRVRVRGIEQLVTEEVKAAVESGSRFVFFESCVSLVFVTWRRPSDIFLIKPGESYLARSWPYTLLSLVLGWWGIPWGLVYTPLAVFTNLRGGRDVTTAVCAFVQDVPSGLAGGLGWIEGTAMTSARVIALSLGLCLAWASAARAGVYSTVEFPDDMLSDFFTQFQGSLATLRGIAIDNSKVKEEKDKVHTIENARHQLAAALAVGHLAAEKLAPDLTVEQRLDASAYLIRTGKFEQAIEFLKPALAKEPRNFLILSNLASAYHGAAGAEVNPLSIALQYVSQALRKNVWPERWQDLDKDRQDYLQKKLNWNEERYLRYRKAETYYRKLLQLRLVEIQQNPRKALEDPQTIDALFLGGDPPMPVRFVGESGKYEAGKLAAAERAKLPADALAIVEQLLVWWPNDNRLYWLLGELFNARGETAPAKAIFDELFLKKNIRSDELVDHRRVLLKAEADAKEKPPAPPNVDAQPAIEPSRPQAVKPIEPAGSEAFPGFLQTLGVGFLAGLVVALLGSWQLRELRRRRDRPVASGH